MKNKKKISSLIRWYGGKYYMRDWVLEHFPPEDSYSIYVEPFGGGANVLLEKKPSSIEVYNDIDDGLVSLFRVFRDLDSLLELHDRISWTLYSREDFLRFKNILMKRIWKDEVEKALAVLLIQNQGFCAKHYLKGVWGYSINTYDVSTGWKKRISLESLLSFNKRLNASQLHIENLDALDCIDKWDSEKTLFYLDPPYVLSTRKCENYINELDDSYHNKLIDKILNVKGKVLLSGYSNPIYDELLNHGWSLDKKSTLSCTSRASTSLFVRRKLDSINFNSDNSLREECLWMNYSLKSSESSEENVGILF